MRSRDLGPIRLEKNRFRIKIRRLNKRKRAAPLRPALENLLPEMYKLTISGGSLRVAPVRVGVLNPSDYPGIHQWLEIFPNN